MIKGTFGMLRGFICALALFSVGASISHAQNFTFKEQEGQVFPDPQVWRVIQVKLAPEAPRDLGGLPVILRGTPIVFGADYISMLSPNRGGMMLAPTCFVRDGERVLLYAMPGQGRSLVSDGTPLEISDGRLVLQVDANLMLIMEQKGFSHPLAEQVLQNAPVRMKERRAKNGGVNRCAEIVEFTNLNNAEPELREIRAKLRKAGIGHDETGRNASEQIARTLSAEELGRWIVGKRAALTEEDYFGFLDAAYGRKVKDFEKAAVISRVMPAITEQSTGNSMIGLALFYKDVPTLLRLLKKVSAPDTVKRGWLISAVRTCESELVDLIMVEGVLPNATDAFWNDVMRCNNERMLTVLAGYGVEASRPMKTAIVTKNREQIEDLLSFGARLETPAEFVRAEQNFADDPELLARLRRAIAFDYVEVERYKKRCLQDGLIVAADGCAK